MYFRPTFYREGYRFGKAMPLRFGLRSNMSAVWGGGVPHKVMVGVGGNVAVEKELVEKDGIVRKDC